MKYNHSKWMTITGALGRQRRRGWMTFTGSANWANLALASDEQMQRITGHPDRGGVPTRLRQDLGASGPRRMPTGRPRARRCDGGHAAAPRCPTDEPDVRPGRTTLPDLTD